MTGMGVPVEVIPDWVSMLAAAAAVIAACASIITLVLVVRQLRVMEAQQRTMMQQATLAQAQLDIVKRQDELMMAQLAHRANLNVEAESERVNDPGATTPVNENQTAGS